VKIEVFNRTSYATDGRWYLAKLTMDGRVWEASASREEWAIKAVLKCYRKEMRHWRRKHLSRAI
jgi:hypothetical protein